MPHVLSLRDVTINSTLGYAARVDARVPKQIPEQLVPEAVQLGCVVCGPNGEPLDPSVEASYLTPAAPATKPRKSEDDLGDVDPETDAPPADVIAEALEVIRQQKAAKVTALPTAELKGPATAPNDPAAYKAAVTKWIATLIAEGDPKNFKQDGTPTQRAIDRVAGFKVDPLVLIEAMAEVNVAG